MAKILKKLHPMDIARFTRNNLAGFLRVSDSQCRILLYRLEIEMSSHLPL